MMDTSQAADPVEVIAYVGLGSNVGDRFLALQAAAHTLDLSDGVLVDAASAVYETEAHVLPGHPPQGDHLNAVLRLRTHRSPSALLRILHSVERAAGRDRSAPPWSPRTLDLDLLAYGDVRMDGPTLTLPHPRIAGRRFVLQPLVDLAPDLVLSDDGATVAELLATTIDHARNARTDFALWPAK